MEEQCFLPDKSKASLRQDVWALAGPRIKEPMAREREPAVHFSWEETWLSLINILCCGVFFLGFLFDPSVAWPHTVDLAQILLISPD